MKEKLADMSFTDQMGELIADLIQILLVPNTQYSTSSKLCIRLSLV